MHVNFSLSNQIESLWGKYLFSYCLAVYNRGEWLYKPCVANEEFLYRESAWPAYAGYRKPIASVASYWLQRSKAREGQRCRPPFSSWSALTSSPCPILSRWLTRPEDRCPILKYLRDPKWTIENKYGCIFRTSYFKGIWIRVDGDRLHSNCVNYLSWFLVCNRLLYSLCV